MKKLTLLSLVAVAVLFTACGEDSKKTAAEATAKTTEAPVQTTEVKKDATADMKKAASDLVAATKAKAAQLAEEAEVEAAQMAQKAKVAADDLKAKAVATTKAAKAAVVAALDNGAGEAAYAKCAGCHGKDGKTKALGKSEVVAGQAAADLETKLAEYKAGTRDISGMGTLMKGQVASMSDDDIKAVSEYMSNM